jgi:hypothetical protein
MICILQDVLRITSLMFDPLKPIKVPTFVGGQYTTASALLLLLLLLWKELAAVKERR